jgi:hypothetical protein
LTLGKLCVDLFLVVGKQILFSTKILANNYYSLCKSWRFPSIVMLGRSDQSTLAASMSRSNSL